MENSLDISLTESNMSDFEIVQATTQEIEYDNYKKLLKTSEKMNKLLSDMYQHKSLGGQESVNIDYIIHCIESDDY